MNISMPSTGLLTVNIAEIEEVSEFKLLGKTVDPLQHMLRIYLVKMEATRPFGFKAPLC